MHLPNSQDSEELQRNPIGVLCTHKTRALNPLKCVCEKICRETQAPPVLRHSARFWLFRFCGYQA